MSLYWQFGLSALLIILAGVRLSRYARVIAEHTRLGGVWVGSVLLAAATSLPEIVASTSASLLSLPDIAVGNVFGSNAFNMLIIAIADLLDGRGSILRKVAPGHILSASLGILLSALAAAGILVGLPLSVLGMGVDTLLIGGIYLLGVVLLSRFEQRSSAEKGIVRPDELPRPKEGPVPDPSLGRAYLGFAAAAALIVFAGVTLSRTADELAAATGLGSTFVGSVFVAAVTSLPEVVTSASAALAGAFDVAIGNVLGSNLFNMAILVVADAAYRPRPILSAVAQSHALVALLGLILSGIVVLGLFYRTRRSIGRLGPDSIAVVLAYALLTYLLYLQR